MKKELYLPIVLIISLLFSGCAVSVGPDLLTLSLELQGELGEVHEVVLCDEKGKTFLLDLGSEQRKTISLNSGLWVLWAYARDAQGNIVSQSTGSSVIQGGGARLAQLTLSATSVATTSVRAKNLAYTVLASGDLEVTWESTMQEPGLWEVWVRAADDLLWSKVGQVAAEQRSFVSDLALEEYIFAVRYVAANLDVEASPLTVLYIGRVDVAWDFQHYFPPVTARYSSFSMPATARQEPEFTDLVAHFKTPESFGQRRELLSELRLQIKGEIPSLKAVLVEPQAHSARTLEEWSVYEDDALFLEPNWIVGPTNMAGQSIPWYLDYIRLPAAHEITTGSASVQISVLDTGLNPEQLRSGIQVVPGYNFSGSEPNENTLDDHHSSHGTKVALSITEVLQSVTIQPIKVLTRSGSGTDFTVSEGLLYAAGLHDSITNPTPAQIINISLGGPETTELMRKRVQLVSENSQAILVAASGNTASGALSPGLYYPAAFPQVIAVGAIVPALDGPRRADYSHWGSELDLVAPPTFEEGTSFSTAVVSGVVGLLLANGAEVDSIKPTLTRTAMDLGERGFDLEYGHGLINAHWAVLDVTSLSLSVLDSAGNVVIREDVPLQGRDAYNSIRYELLPGEYVVEAWLNLQGDNAPQPGDYFGRSAQFTVQANQQQRSNVTLTELGL